MKGFGWMAAVACVFIIMMVGVSHQSIDRLKTSRSNQFNTHRDFESFTKLRQYMLTRGFKSTEEFLQSKPLTRFYHQRVTRQVDSPPSPNTNYIYRGPTSKDICDQGLYGMYLNDLWCEHVNPYSGTPEIISDVPIMNSANFSYECIGTSNDTQMDDCYAVIGVRAFDMNVFGLSMSYMVETLRNGRIFLMRTNIQFILGGANLIYYYPDRFSHIIRFDGHSKVTGVGADADDHITLAQFSKDSSQIYINGMRDLALMPGTWFYALDPSIIDVTQLKMLREPTSQNIYSVALAKISQYKYQLIFIQVVRDGEHRIVVTWDITLPNGNEKVNFDWTHQHGNFSENAPMRVNDAIFFANRYSSARALIVIHTDSQVRVFEFSDKSTSMQIDFTKQDILSTFYTAPAFSKITYSYLITETIRRPMTLNRFSTCSNTQFPPSQNIFLAVGLKQNYNGPSAEVYHLVLHHINEFNQYTFYGSSQTNPANRPSDFKCQPSEFIDTNGDCSANIENYRSFDAEIVTIRSRFNDVNETVAGYTTYNATGHLNPQTFCGLSYPLQISNRKQKCLEMAQDITCEIDILNGGLGDERNLQPFFLGYWQENIYITKKDLSIEIHSLSMDLDSLNTQAYGTLTKLNRFKTLGYPIDVFITPNNQHVFISVSRKQWEIKSMERYALVCSTLKTDPDNVFLKPFKDECELVPAQPINENQFALLASVCLKGNLCSFFRKNLITKSASQGTFVYRSLTEFPCIPGSYCVAGIRIPCPVGFICHDFGMAAPRKCNANPDYQTCYSDSLTDAFTCPNGTICTTDYLVPLPASPGHYLKKINQGQGNVQIIGLEECQIGDYCNLGREAIITPNNASLSVLLCPADTYCTNTSILQPSLCSFVNGTMDYCPPGTIYQELCPAGFYCENPNSIKQCSLTQYCPAGSFTYELCPEGYYCPNASVQIFCPSGYFCRQGSVEPSPCSWFLSSCPAGSYSDRMTYGGLILVLALLLSIAILYFAYETAFKFYVKRSVRQKNKSPSEITSLFSSNQKQQNYSNNGSSSHQSFHEGQFTVDIGFQDLGLVLRGSGKKVLNGVTGEIKHGKLTAVMGLSGAGKSTFITTLSNRAYYGTQIGKVLVNGKEEHLSNYNRKIGFVPQDDIMIPSMTVEETLFFSAKTRLDASTPTKQINQIVNDVINVLRLEDVRHSIIGDQEKRGISGGQRKRVNVGIELVAAPYVLFLDEPTSGLDSASSKEVCEALQAIASSGITVITVIHQPRFEIFNMFDNLLLLGKGGRTIYLGEVTRVAQYFEEVGFVKPSGTNLADFVIDLSAGLVQNEANDFDPSILPDIWEEKKGQYTPKDETPVVSNGDEGSIQDMPEKKTPKFKNPRLPYFTQFIMCLKRSFVQLLRTLPSLVLDYSLIFLCGAFLGLIYYNKVYIGPPPKAVYEMCPNGLEEICSAPIEDPIYSTSSLMTLAMALMGAMSALRVYGKESLVFFRESQTGLSTFCYFWAKDVTMLVVNIFAPMVFLSIYYTTVSPRAAVYEYYYVLLLAYWTSYGLGYFISIIIQPNIAQLTAVVIVFIFNVFSGATTPLPSFKSMYFPINILPNLSYLTYSHENAYLIELKRYENIYDVSKSLKMMGYEWDDFYMTIYMMIVFGFVFRIAAFIALVCVKPSSFFNLAVVSTHNFFTTKIRLLFRLCGKKDKSAV